MLKAALSPLRPVWLDRSSPPPTPKVRLLLPPRQSRACLSTTLAPSSLRAVLPLLLLLSLRRVARRHLKRLMLLPQTSTVTPSFCRMLHTEKSLPQRMPEAARSSPPTRPVAVLSAVWSCTRPLFRTDKERLSPLLQLSEPLAQRVPQLQQVQLRLQRRPRVRLVFKMPLPHLHAALAQDLWPL